MSTHEATSVDSSVPAQPGVSAQPTKPRRGGAVRILAQAGFILIACLGCTIVLITMMEGSLSGSFADSLKGQLSQYAATAARIIPSAAITQGDEEAQAYLRSFLASLFSAATADQEVEFGYALFRLEGEDVQILSLSANVGGASGSAEQYRSVAQSGETVIWEDGSRLSALCAITDEDGAVIGIVEIVGDWSVYSGNGSELRQRMLIACGIGVVCMMGVYVLMAVISSVRERNAKGDGQ